jgi:hypothetical protein
VWIVKTVGSHGPGPAPRPEKSTESSRPRAWSRPYHWDCSKFCSLLPVITSACQIPLDRPLFVTVMNWCVLAGFWPALPLNGLYFYPLIPFAMNLCHLCQKKKKNCCFSASHWPQGLLFAQNPKSKTCVVLEVISDGFLSGLSGSTIARHVRR